MRFLFLLFFLVFCNTKILIALDTKSTHAVVLDFETEDILFSKNKDELTPPASMTKIMTVYIVFDRIRPRFQKWISVYIDIYTSPPL